MPEATAGAGIFDTLNETRVDVEAAANGLNNPGDLAVDGLSLGLDALGFVANPLSGLLSAGIGWLIEHLDFLKEPLDALAGDPSAVTRVAITWGEEVKSEVVEVAESFREAVRRETVSWQGDAADAYRKLADGVAAQLESLESAARSVSAAIQNSGVLVATVRGIIRDLIADVVAELVIAAASALATSWATFGGSIAAFTGYAVARGAATAGKIASKISKLMTKLAEILNKFSHLRGAVQALGRTARKFDDIAQNLGRAAGRHGEAARTVMNRADQIKRGFADNTVGRVLPDSVRDAAGRIDEKYLGMRGNDGFADTFNSDALGVGVIKGTLNDEVNQDDNYQTELGKTEAEKQEEERSQQGT